MVDGQGLLPVPAVDGGQSRRKKQLSGVVPVNLLSALLPRRGLGVDALSRQLTKTLPETSGELPEQAVWLRRLLLLCHWPSGRSRWGIAVGVLLICAALLTRAVWTAVFLIMFGMDVHYAMMISLTFFSCVLPMAVFYHLKIFTEPHLLARLLIALDTDGGHIRAIEKRAKRSIAFGFIGWGLSWCVSWWLVFSPLRSGGLHISGYKHFQLLMSALLPIDLVFGRALEHKAQLLSLYIHEVSSLVVKSIEKFATEVEDILSTSCEDCDGAEVSERLHQAEGRVRSHLKWLNEDEGTALLVFIAQEGLCAVYTTALALYTDDPWLEFGLLLYACCQLLMLLKTGLDIAKPGDAYFERVQNLDMPRIMLTVSKRFEGMGLTGSDYVKHLYRTCSGVKIYTTVVRTPVVVSSAFTLALPTFFVALSQMTHVFETTSRH